MAGKKLPEPVRKGRHTSTERLPWISVDETREQTLVFTSSDVYLGTSPLNAFVEKSNDPSKARLKTAFFSQLRDNGNQTIIWEKPDVP